MAQSRTIWNVPALSAKCSARTKTALPCVMLLLSPHSFFTWLWASSGQVQIVLQRDAKRCREVTLATEGHSRLGKCGAGHVTGPIASADSMIAFTAFNSASGSAAMCSEAQAYRRSVNRPQICFRVGMERGSISDNPCHARTNRDLSVVVIVSLGRMARRICSAAAGGSEPTKRRNTSAQVSSSSRGVTWSRMSALTSTCCALNCSDSSSAQRYSRKVRCTNPYSPGPRNVSAQLRSSRRRSVSLAARPALGGPKRH